MWQVALMIVAVPVSIMFFIDISKTVGQYIQEKRWERERQERAKDSK